jgi:hypothetical protein
VRDRIVRPIVILDCEGDGVGARCGEIIGGVLVAAVSHVVAEVPAAYSNRPG